MVLSKHYLQGIGRFSEDTMHSEHFEKILKKHGYYLIGIQDAKHGRFCYIFDHDSYRSIYAIYNKSGQMVITAYHPD